MVKTQKKDKIAPKPAKWSNHKTGHFAEKVALFYLLLRGYIPVARNFVVGRGTGAGEIDLIVKRGKTLVFVEVKKRATLGAALEAITIENQMRVARASAAFLKRYPQYQSYQMRYDAMLFSRRHWWPKHMHDAWRIM